jgi:hypothetical protein
VASFVIFGLFLGCFPRWQTFEFDLDLQRTAEALLGFKIIQSTTESKDSALVGSSSLG